MNSPHSDALQLLPLGTITPRAWLRAQLEIQRDGLTTWLADNWPDISQSKWIGGTAEGWERGPYWLDGAIPLAFVLNDEPLKKRVQFWIDAILERQHEDGWLGEKHDEHSGSGEHTLDPWPLAIVFKAFISWHSATGDERIVPAMSRAFQAIDKLTDEKPLDNWAKLRWPELAIGAQWLHQQTGEAWLLKLTEKFKAQGHDWRAHFTDFPFPERAIEWKLENHVVNHAMALKEPAVRARSDHNDQDGLKQAHHYIAMLDKFHGQATGIFSGDESLAGLNPSQGSELCAVVEYLYSLEELLLTFGDAHFAERWENIAFNALPATFTADMMAHQYDQQVNQVLCSHEPRDWVSNGPSSNLFGIEPNFGCCTANMHQGWPKFVQHLWMTNGQEDLVALSLAPCEVDHAGFRIETQSQYPFRDEVIYTIHLENPTSKTLQFRIPAWAKLATLQINGESEQPVFADAFHSVERQWNDGDIIRLQLPMELRARHRPNGAVSIWRGPLMFGLKIEEEFRRVKDEAHADWEVHPRSPWNYALDGDASTWSVQTGQIGAQPFDPKHSPVTIRAKGRQIESWQMKHNSADVPPPSPVETSFSAEEIELIPYGATHLRIGEFPVTKEFEM